jgi:steroid delta-isomerase-like uncharacterized protein
MSTPEENKAVMRRFEAAINAADLAMRDTLLDEVVAPDYVDHSPIGIASQGGREGLKRALTAARAAFPDFRTTLHDLMGEGDKCAVRFTTSGTHRGEFAGIPPTDKSFAMPGIAIYRVRDGQLAERWAAADQLGMMQQLGVIPAPGQAG